MAYRRLKVALLKLPDMSKILCHNAAIIVAREPNAELVDSRWSTNAK
jgi:hypothetical protein